jgi:hypothetical protein
LDWVEELPDRSWSIGRYRRLKPMTKFVLWAIGYIVFYAAFTLVIKYYTGSPNKGLPGLGSMEVLWNTTLGSMLLMSMVMLFGRWWRFIEHQPGAKKILWGLLPARYLLVIVSGFGAAFVIPTTSVMCAFKGVNVLQKNALF